VLRALVEAGVPVDRIGGTSMGASMAAGWALGWGVEGMLRMNRRVWVEIRPHKVLTLPVVSILGTRKAHACGRLMYGDAQVEDLWIPFFCVSSSLTRARQVVHRRGSLLWACTASASLPGIAAPVLVDGELLVDGALLNNVPADVMRAEGAGVVIAVEVSPEGEGAFSPPRVPTAWQALGDRWRGQRFPSIPEVMMRASMLHSIGRERDVAELANLFLHPPVDRFPMMDFSGLDALAEAGYEYAAPQVAAWLAAGGMH
jgi:predicted acylesterase/phospholipase RssA